MPTNLVNFAVSVRSYWPKKVYGGYLYSNDSRHLETGLRCNHGYIKIQFPNSGMDALGFAKALHISEHRDSTSIEIDTSDINFEQYGPEIMELMPMCRNEKVVDTVVGHLDWVSFSTCNGLIRCDGRYGPICFPWLPYMSTCCLLPLHGTKEDIVLTTNSIISLFKQQNFGCCGCMGALAPDLEDPCCQEKLLCNTQGFSMTWTSVDHLTGYETEVRASGRDNFLSRSCSGNPLGEIFCPVSTSYFGVSIDLDKYHIKVHDQKKNYNFNQDAQLLRSTSTLSKMQLQLQERALERIDSIQTTQPKTARLSSALPDSEELLWLKAELSKAKDQIQSQVLINKGLREQLSTCSNEETARLQVELATSRAMVDEQVGLNHHLHEELDVVTEHAKEDVIKLSESLSRENASDQVRHMMELAQNDLNEVSGVLHSMEQKLDAAPPLAPLSAPPEIPILEDEESLQGYENKYAVQQKENTEEVRQVEHVEQLIQEHTALEGHEHHHLDLWEQHHDEAGNAYYYHTQTGESSWDPPSGFLERLKHRVEF